MNAQVAQAGPKLVFSNFLITISSNVAPMDMSEQNNVTQWLKGVCDELFNNPARLNGTVLKPAGTPNEDERDFGHPNRLVSMKSRIGFEVGDEKGYVHAHIVLEVAHRYSDVSWNQVAPNGENYKGVHVNVLTLRNFLNSQIDDMQLPANRRPQRIYVNSRLLTNGTDNSSKWLTYQYINKTVARDNDGGERDLTADRQFAPFRDVEIAAAVTGDDVVIHEVEGNPAPAQDDNPMDNNTDEDDAPPPPPQPPGMRRVTIPMPQIADQRRRRPTFAPGQTNPRYGLQ